MEESSHRPRVVIAEDFVLIQESMRLALERDCDVMATVEDGEAALDAVAMHHADILLLDVSLPKLGGFMVAEKLSRANSAVKVIFVTAYTDKTYVERAFEIGAKGYVLKGALQTELLAAIREVTNGGVYRSPHLSVVRP
jgi:DNA-binding NarL/FixJ family response regulator